MGTVLKARMRRQMPSGQSWERQENGDSATPVAIRWQFTICCPRKPSGDVAERLKAAVC